MGKPQGCYLKRVSDSVKMVYLFLSDEEFVKARPGQIREFNGETVYVDDVGPIYLPGLGSLKSVTGWNFKGNKT